MTGETKIKVWAVYVKGHELPLTGISMLKQVSLAFQEENWTKENSRVIPCEIIYAKQD
jgi:hypothetical protein